MAGKNTAENGRHFSREVEIIRAVSLSDGLIADLCTAIGRTLSAAEVARIADTLGIFRHLRALQNFEGIATRQDIKRTLAAIAKLKGDQAAAALANCDALSEGAIIRQMYKAIASESDQIATAARAALAELNCKSDQGGRPRKEYQAQLAAACADLWRGFGATDMTVGNHWDGSLSPLLEWTTLLLSSIEPGDFDPRKAQRLLSEAIKGRFLP